MIINIKIIFIIILIFGFLGILTHAGIFSDSIIRGNENNTIPDATTNSRLLEKDLPHITRTTSSLHVNATIYQNASSLPAYWGVLDKNGSINIHLQQLGKIRKNVTTEVEAPEIAKRILESYGGLPPDAKYDSAETTYIEEYNHTLNSVTARWPEFTTVSYSYKINNLPLFGDSNNIILTLGSNGELLWIFKEWRKYTFINDVPIISVDKAIDKLERQELIESSWHPEEGNVTIDSIGLGYYAKNTGNSETITEPLWLMYGTGESGSRLGFYVYARQFANFTAIPTTTSQSEGIAFKDISDTSPNRWYWDFGDGINSTLRNPVHFYQNAGNYTVKLTVWNDVGSDTLIKTNYITILSARMSESDSGTPARNP